MGSVCATRASWAKTARSEGVLEIVMARAAVWMASASAMKASQVWTVVSVPAPMTAATWDSVSPAAASATKATQEKTAPRVSMRRTS